MSSLHARSAGRTSFVPSLSTKFLKTPKLRRRWATSLTASLEWKAATEAMKVVPEGTLEQVEKALHLVEGAVVAAAAPFQPPPHFLNVSQDGGIYRYHSFSASRHGALDCKNPNHH